WSSGGVGSEDAATGGSLAGVAEPPAAAVGVRRAGRLAALFAGPAGAVAFGFGRGVFCAFGAFGSIGPSLRFGHPEGSAERHPGDSSRPGRGAPTRPPRTARRRPPSRPRRTRPGSSGSAAP